MMTRKAAILGLLMLFGWHGEDQKKKKQAALLPKFRPILQSPDEAVTLPTPAYKRGDKVEPETNNLWFGGNAATFAFSVNSDLKGSAGVLGVTADGRTVEFTAKGVMDALGAK